jgi:hypothetical protein
MKWRTAFVAVAALALASCAGLGSTIVGGLSGPAAIANKTTLDERALLGLEASYKAARLAMEGAVDAGLVKRPLAVKFRDANKKANAVLVKARTAYDAANAATLDAALDEGAPLVAEIWKLVAEQEKTYGR